MLRKLSHTSTFLLTVLSPVQKCTIAVAVWHFQQIFCCAIKCVRVGLTTFRVYKARVQSITTPHAGGAVISFVTAGRCHQGSQLLALRGLRGTSTACRLHEGRSRFHYSSALILMSSDVPGEVHECVSVRHFVRVPIARYGTLDHSSQTQQR